MSDAKWDEDFLKTAQVPFRIKQASNGEKKIRSNATPGLRHQMGMV